MAVSSTSIGAASVNVRVRGQDDRVLYFKINRTTKLSRLFQIYCERRQLDVRTMQFLYEGNRITGNQTPIALGLEEGSEICAVVHQSGGGRQQHGRCISC
ncbi:hypothetical protein BT93_H0191 [Corymbia citriodora subsp. variegata]|nr:hypothetical protein BT93_H0191 [Corymbia citriodora subsp. variegata]